MSDNIYNVALNVEQYENKHCKLIKESNQKDNLVKQILHNGKEISLNPPLPESQVTCPACRGNHGFYVKWEYSWFCMAPECMTRNAEATKRAKALSGTQQKQQAATTIPVAYKNASLVKISDFPKVRDFLSLFAEKPNEFVVLFGNPGTGKTYAACAALNLYFQNGNNDQDICFIETNDLCRQWLDNKTEGKSEVAFINKFIELQFLVLDDLGTRAPTEAFLDFLHSIFNKRINERKGTILTTNLTQESLSEKF